MPKRLSLEDFILKSNTIHNSKYSYTQSIYFNSITKIKIICSVHGIFEQMPRDHMRGRGCDKCGGTATKSGEEFIIEANIIHNYKFDYSKVNYVRTDKYIIIVCQYTASFCNYQKNI